MSPGARYMSEKTMKERTSSTPSMPSTRTAASRTVVVASVPEPLTGGAIVKHMYETYNTVIAGARNKLSGRVVRIGTMGQISEADILTDLHYLELSLTALGHKVPSPGCGVTAAIASLR